MEDGIITDGVSVDGIVIMYGLIHAFTMVDGMVEIGVVADGTMKMETMDMVEDTTTDMMDMVAVKVDMTTDMVAVKVDMTTDMVAVKVDMVAMEDKDKGMDTMMKEHRDKSSKKKNKKLSN
jgi:hypothetical protein